MLDHPRMTIDEDEEDKIFKTKGRVVVKKHAYEHY